MGYGLLLVQRLLGSTWIVKPRLVGFLDFALVPRHHDICHLQLLNTCSPEYEVAGAIGPDMDKKDYDQLRDDLRRTLRLHPIFLNTAAD